MRAVPAISHGLYDPSRFRLVVLEFPDAEQAERYDELDDDFKARQVIEILVRRLAS